MKNIFKTFCAHQLKTKPKKPLESFDLKKKCEDSQVWRDILAYWILGLSTEFGYVVIISAAHDILHGFGHSSNNNPTTISNSTADGVAIARQSVCAAPSTGVLLLADIVPSVLMNISCPFLPLVKNFRMILVIILNVSSFLLISTAEADYLQIIGVVLTSLALGIGEVTLLSYSAEFNKKVITAWASGTGSAGIIGSISWAGLIALGVSPQDTLRIMLIVPVIQSAAFWILLRSPQKKTISNYIRKIDIAVIESNNNNYSPEIITPPAQIKLSGLKAKLKFIPKLVTFIAPLVIVFIFEYICVSGLFEMTYARDTWLEPQSQYRWFLVVYQIGVFSSRSLGAFLKPRRTWWATILQISNAGYFMYVVTSSRPSSIWIIFIFVFGLGAVGGICYVHTFHRLLKELPSNQHKFSLGMVTIAESIGIAIGGFTAITIHNMLCGIFFVNQ